jgi:manganese oxidase
VDTDPQTETARRPQVPQGSLPVGTSAAIVAILALVLAAVGLVIKSDGDDDVATTSIVSVELTEFTITPSAVQVPAGGSLKVTNIGAAAHNVTVTGTDVATAELAAGESEELDLSSLEPGEYEILCSIPGHAESGMTGALTITESGDAGGPSSGGTSGMAGMSDGETAAMDHSQQMTEADYERMDQAMEETIAAYPAETEGVGNEPLEPEVLADGTKQFELTAAVTPWEVEPGKTVDAWTYNGMAPGPMLHVEVGDKVRIVLHNDLPMGTDVHLHGINVPNSMDGVAPITQDLVTPGESFTYDFTADEPAVAMYHAHHHAQMQVPNGLFGTFLVGEMPLPAGRTVGGEAIPADVEVSQELPLVLNDSGVIGYSLNGKSFPATTPITANTGDWILVHYFNEGGQIHPMHLHQFDQVVVAKDGFPLDQPYVVDTLNVAPGERYSVLVHLDEPGTWVWHCHILNHVESDEGMFGMVTAVVVQ